MHTTIKQITRRGGVVGDNDNDDDDDDNNDNDDDDNNDEINKLLNKLSQILLCTIWTDKGLFDCRV